MYVTCALNVIYAIHILMSVRYVICVTCVAHTRNVLSFIHLMYDIYRIYRIYVIHAMYVIYASDAINEYFHCWGRGAMNRQHCRGKDHEPPTLPKYIKHITDTM